MPSKKDESKKSYEKQFVVRNSLLTQIFENENTRNLYNVYLIVFTLLLFQNVAREYVTKGSISLGIKTIKAGFTKFDKAVLIWLCCFGSTCLSFFCFQVWAKFRTLKDGLTKKWDYFWALSLLCYYIYTLKFAHDAIVYFGFNPVCAAFISVDCVRLLMKVHSFVRNAATPLLHSKQAPNSVTFSHFLYFLFAPTLIYRDHYPRTKNINWKLVIQHLLECISVIFLYAFALEVIYPPPEKFLAKFSPSDIMLLILDVIPYAGLIIAATFLLVLHSLQNFFAEITRFGDRLFYLDWWNAHSVTTWLPKWNLLVRDWLYFYIYLDFKHFILDSTYLAVCVVLLVSFMAHDYIMFCCFGISLPFLVLLSVLVFLLSFYFDFEKSVFLNVFMWSSMCISTAAIIMFYIFEYYAMTEAPLDNPTLLDLFMPRFMTCGCVLVES